MRFHIIFIFIIIVMEITLIEEFKRSWLTSIIGILLFFASVFGLVWNEGRAVHQAHSLEEAYANVIAVSPYEPIRPELDGRLVHTSGNLLIDEPLTEYEYGVSIQGVKLKRRVQMFQWVEERHQRDFGDSVTSQASETDYYYVTEWRDKLVDSRNFYIRHGHHNPTEKPLETYIYVSPIVRVGQLSLGTDLKDKFNEYVEVTGDQRPERHDIKLHMGIYYHCDDVWKPQVGDIRIQFYYAGLNGDPVSVIGMQKDGVLVPYTTARGHVISMMRPGVMTVPQMFKAEHSDARWETWKLRAAGTFVMYAAAVCLSKLIHIMLLKAMNLPPMTYSDEIPGYTRLIMSLSVALLFISLSWMFHHPTIGFGIFLASISPIAYFTMVLFNYAQEQELRRRT